MNLQPINASASPEVQMNENFVVLDWATVYGKNSVTTTGLTWGYFGGRWGGFLVTADTLTLADGADNFVVIAAATGAITVESPAANWNNQVDYRRVYKLTTVAGAVTVIEDHRNGPGGALSGGLGPQGVQGDVGLQGPTGDQGIQGITGDTGPQGIQGIQGDTGPAGADGAGTGDVVGPASATDGLLALFDGATGKLLKAAAVNLAALAQLDATQSWTKAQSGVPVALTSTAASIAVDLALANNFTHTTTENTTLAAPTNPVAGQSGCIIVTQDGTTPFTLAYDAFWKFPGGTVPDLTATAAAVDIFTYYIESATRATCALLKDVK